MFEKKKQKTPKNFGSLKNFQFQFKLIILPSGLSQMTTKVKREHLKILVDVE